MAKSPASLLNEIAAKHCLPLVYENLPSISGKNKTEYQIMVICDGHVANGISTSKKAAKQDAALSMLQYLKKIGIINEKVLEQLDLSKTKSSETVSSVSEDNVENFVGQLNEFCQTHGYVQPSYQLVKVEGSSHSPLFTMSCSVSSISKEGVANNKKSAKHKAAQNVLTVIKGDAGLPAATKQQLSSVSNSSTLNGIDQLSLGLQEISFEDTGRRKAISASEIESAKKNYLETKHCAPKFELASEHLMLKSKIQAISEAGKAKLLFLFQQKERMETSKIQQIIVDTLAIPPPKIFYLKSKSKEIFITVYKLQLPPSIVQIGMGRTDIAAKTNAVHKLLNLIIFFLKQQ